MSDEENTGSCLMGMNADPLRLRRTNIIFVVLNAAPDLQYIGNLATFPQQQHFSARLYPMKISCD